MKLVERVIASICVWMSFLGVIVLSPAVVAQADADDVTRGFAYPNPSVTTVDDLTAVEINPAGLSLVDGGEFAYGLGLESPLGDDKFNTEHSVLLSGGTGDFGGGLALQWLRGEFGGRTISYHKHSLGLGFKPANMFSVGTSLHLFGSSESRALDKLATWDVGFQFRPTSFLGIGFTARSINQPFLTTFDSIPMTLHPGLAFRFLDGRIVLDGALAWNTGTDQTDVRPRFSVEPIPGLNLFARADIPLGSGGEEAFEETRFSGGLAVNFGHVGLRSSAESEHHNRSMQFTRHTHLVRTTTQRETSLIPHGRRWVRATIDDSLAERGESPLFGPEKRSILQTIETFRQMSDDPEIDGIVLDIQPNDLGYAQVWELRQAVHSLRDAGKKVVALLQAPDTPNAYLAAAADKTWLIPSEPYEPVGLSTRSTYYAGVLDKLGIRAEFVRIGEYKSAPESFVRRTPSEAARRQTNAYLDSIFETVVAGLSKDADKAEDAVRAMFDSVPLLPDRAISKGYVDDVVYPDEIRSKLQSSYGSIANLQDEYVETSSGNEHWESPMEVAVIYIDGSIVRGRSGSAPLIGEMVTGHETISRTVDELLSAPDVRAAVVRIDSPGGSAVASDLIYREIRRLAAQMPVVASMGDVAASGGYYVAAGADEIYATPNTLTGSIGIFAGKFSISNLADFIGLNSTQYQRGDTAGKYNAFEPWTRAERQSVTTSMTYLYQLFLEQVARTRPLEPAEIDTLARGRVWAGDAAVDKKLVDKTGSLVDAIHRAEKLAGLQPGQADYQAYPSGTSFPDFAGGVAADIRRWLTKQPANTSTTSAADRLLNQITDAAALPLLYGQKQPLMLPYTPLEIQ